MIKTKEKEAPGTVPDSVREYSSSDLQSRYVEMTACFRCWCSLTSELVGGLPADEKALDAFAEHHLGIADPEERAKAVQRILKEEVGERDITRLAPHWRARIGLRLRFDRAHHDSFFGDKDHHAPRAQVGDNSTRGVENGRP